MSSAAARSCVFCDGQPVNREHLWPNWVTDVLPDDAEIECSHSWQRGVSAPAEFVKRPFQLTVRAVCEVCNGGWMSDIEGAAKQIVSGMIQGRGRELHRQGQTTIAVWSVLKAMMFACTAPEQPLRKELFRQLLADPSQPPPNVHVWIARAEASLLAFWSARGLALDTNEPVPAAADHPHFYLSTISVNHLVVRVLFNNEPGDDHTLIHGPAIASALAPIWPIEKGTFVWPTGPNLTTRGLHRLASTGSGKLP